MDGKPRQIGGQKMSKKEAIERINKPRKDKITGEEVKPINSYFTTDLDKVVTGSEEKTYTAFINKDDLGEQVLDLPDELLEKMGWEPGDIIGIEETMNCFDDGECQGLVLTNLSKEKK